VNICLLFVCVFVCEIHHIISKWHPHKCVDFLFFVPFYLPFSRTILPSFTPPPPPTTCGSPPFLCPSCVHPQHTHAHTQTNRWHFAPYEVCVLDTLLCSGGRCVHATPCIVLQIMLSFQNMCYFCFFLCMSECVCVCFSCYKSFVCFVNIYICFTLRHHHQAHTMIFTEQHTQSSATLLFSPLVMICCVICVFSLSIKRNVLVFELL
jgi:hypothetical protein